MLKLSHLAGPILLACMIVSTSATAQSLQATPGPDVHGFSSGIAIADLRGRPQSPGIAIADLGGRPQSRGQHVSKRHWAVVQHRSSDAPAKVAAIGETAILLEARRYIGGNPTGKSSLWCAAFMNYVLKRTGHSGSGSNMARSFASYGTRVSGPRVGAIAVMWRKGGGHVGIVSGIDAKGNVIVISGNHRKRVAESVYPRGRIYAYVVP
jgi:uncharacterized protein (TIGR02594 family)